jgi:hypothetical protein
MIHMPYFLRFAKNNLHLELGVGCLYSTSCREEVFSETRIQLVVYLYVRTGARRIRTRLLHMETRHGKVRERGRPEPHAAAGQRP